MNENKIDVRKFDEEQKAFLKSLCDDIDRRHSGDIMMPNNETEMLLMVMFQALNEMRPDWMSAASEELLTDLKVCYAALQYAEILAIDDK